MYSFVLLFLYVYVTDNAFICFKNYKIRYPLSLASINCSFSTNQSQTHYPSSNVTRSKAKSPIHSPSSYQTKNKDKSQYHSPSSYQTITEPKSQTQPPSSYQSSIPISSLIKKKFSLLSQIWLPLLKTLLKNHLIHLINILIKPSRI